tara:strand:- start:132 stop:1718 length:1587 start_codon:yes stop_codon:yes gene_type:complete
MFKFILKLVRFIILQLHYVKIYFFDINFRNFLKYLEKNKIEKKKNNDFLLFDHFETFEIILFRLHFFINFCKLNGCNIGVFNLKRNLLFKKIYSTFGVNKFFKQKLDKDDYQELNNIFNQTFYKLNTKEDLFNFKIQNIDIGKDIYESYLIRFHKPTLDITDLKFKKLFKEALEILLYWKKVFLKHNIKGVYVSHRSYVETNIISKLAYQNKIPVYTNNGAVTKFSKHLSSELDNTKFYKFIFNELSENEKNKAIEISKKRIQLKFDGKIGVDMSYSEKTAFHKSKINQTVLKKSNNIKVLICTHCFYDNPQCYGGLLYLDFYEWLCHLSEIAKKTDYDWYIKPHPDYLPGTMEILKDITSKFDQITLIDPDTSFFQLAEEGLNFALTCHGTIAQELPLLGIDVINADVNNPHCAFNFSYTPKNLKEYEKTLLDLKNFKSLVDNKDQIYEYYYLSNYYFQDKELFFKNYDEYLFYPNKDSIHFCNFFLKNFKEEKNLELSKKLLYFLKNNKKYTLPDEKLKIIMKYEN